MKHASVQGYELLEDEASRSGVGKAPYARAKSEFTLERMWDGLLAVYQTVTASRDW